MPCSDDAARYPYCVGNVLKTIVFLVVVWFTLLFVLPIAVSIVEIELGIQRFPPQLLLAMLLLGVFTLLGFWAAFTLALRGAAPFGPPHELVVSGPYSYVRHPFVIALVGQGIGIAIAMGSIPVIVYVVLLLMVYYFVMRRREEDKLEARFGEPVRAYMRAVRGFRPRLSPYKPGSR
jgi:protein-S-isoprenylcysteine O-methyltransferase Ste14